MLRSLRSAGLGLVGAAMAAAAAPATPAAAAPAMAAVPPVVPGLAASASASAAGPTADWPAQPGPCRLDGLATALRCASLRRPLDPARPDGVQIALHYAVLPALSRHKADDPVVFLAGGPGQSATELAGPLAAAYQRLGQRRDLVFIDQRGTGRSAPLRCPDDAADAPVRALAEQADDTARLARLRACRRALQALPHGDLRFYGTAIASADLDAVRAALGVARLNLIAASYGTRAALDYQRQFPSRVRRAVLDGVVPPDMHLADAAAQDNQAALDGVIKACAAEPACARRHPALRAQWQALLAGLPRTVSLPHPVSGLPEAVTLSRDGLLGLVRGPLYAPALAAGLPAAVAEAAQGRWAALAALGSSLGGGGRLGGIATGMHLSVVCTEDPPAADPPAPAPAPAPSASAADFGDSLARFYRAACADWPRGSLPADFARLPPSAAPVWLLSGGADPVTPPRHAERVRQALGTRARHGVVAQAGHGLAQLPCVRDAVQRFISADDDAQALAVADAGVACAADLPRPPAFAPPGLPPGLPPGRAQERTAGVVR